MGAALLVFVDLPGSELDDAGRGILAEGGPLAELLGVPWAAACFAGAGPAVREAFKPYGVPEILEIDAGPRIAEQPVARADALAQAARGVGARAILLAHTDMGSTLAPALASRLCAALFTEAISYSRDWAGLTLRRQAVGAQAVDQRIWTDAALGDGGSLRERHDSSRVLVFTMAARVLSAAVLPGAARGEARPTPFAAVPAATRAALRVVEEIPPDPETMDVTDAPVIFTAGLGCDRATFEQLCELASLVGASVGVTRPVYDLGWRGYERMIGQTGRTVFPRLYFAFGISGSMQHVGGITDSQRIVCINIDPKASIFPNADEGFVADLREVLPRLLEKVRAAKADAMPRALKAGVP